MSKLLDPSAATSRYLSRIPRRRPEEKLHTGIGHAKSAVTAYFSGGEFGYTGPSMEIYELVDGGWKLLYSVVGGDLELPWKTGELTKKRKQQEKAKKDAERTEYGRIIDLAVAAHKKETYIGQPSLTLVEYVHIYKLGYEQGKEDSIDA